MEAIKVYTVPFEITYTYTREIGKFFKKQKQDSVTFKTSQMVTARSLRRPAHGCKRPARPSFQKKPI